VIIITMWAKTDLSQEGPEISAKTAVKTPAGNDAQWVDNARDPTINAALKRAQLPAAVVHRVRKLVHDHGGTCLVRGIKQAHRP
jgi:hypothetical protein